MKRILKAVLIVLLAILVLAGGFVGVVWAYSATYRIPKQAASIENTTGLVQAHGRTLYDASGKPLQLTGINAGQLLLQESWMSPFALEPLKNPDGSYVKDKDNNIQYGEFTEDMFREALKNNPNLSGYSLEELLQTYYSCFFTEEDFRIIKEDLQLNAIRFPFFYLDILNEDLTLKSEDAAFSYLDWFISQAAKYELYIILDLHGAPGSQNGYEHSGTAGYTAGLWESKENVDATVAIWDYISNHYMNTRPDLGKWIATYDILNEPTYTYKGTTNKKCWEVFDRIYDTIRENGDKHVITMSGCWDFNNLPNPKAYDWENVQYQYHWYNWNPDQFPYSLFHIMKDFYNIGRDYDVPVLIGEFTAFEDKAAWEQILNFYDSRNYSWTIWSYKTCVTGWWNSSWGVYTCQLKFVTEWEQIKCNVSTCTYEEYVETCRKTLTQNCETGTLYEVIKAHRAK